MVNEILNVLISKDKSKITADKTFFMNNYYFYYYHFKEFVYLFILKREKDSGGEGKRGRENLKQMPHRAQSPMWLSIPYP